MVIVPAAGAGVEFGEWEAEVSTASMRVTDIPRLPPEVSPRGRSVDLAEAEDFLRLFHAETEAGETRLRERWDGVRAEIDETGTYRHTTDELEFGARVAWRNSARCIGRLYWQGLKVRDRRDAAGAAAIADECVTHLREATRGGRIRSTITVFAPDGPAGPGPKIHNDQLIRYAGYRLSDGSVLGDPRHADFTETVREHGWRPPERKGSFDVLPLLIESEPGERRLFRLPSDAVLEVPLSHPDHRWFAGLGLRWHAVPAISNMRLVIGGITYPAAPFNGWYLATEVGARNLADTDRYDLLPVIADLMGLSTASERTLWRDRTLVELTLAVQHSFDAAGVTVADHHSESRRFLTHIAKEEHAGRRCQAEWSWIVPPLSGGQTAVFHRYYDEPDPAARPAFLPPG
ncbi:nitric oxide synthase oxygenase [Amycolatopsis sp. BJA-103]|uniref:nitric oxide synthase oxygenase n=1 Tax=Amycolatopsis sp. BJA-103 TaxID=1911175 RepID=UPI000CA38E4F|nr:nitric oxide synthase oxygenase [Amycolatopsis sp. BJA-103]AUI58075.1 nitric oxide synthase oxygenase [Amycolatopsis sp. BJA-103]PNE15640.1 nitric oxide synthase oxygenase [Amycolatopsis sp. BJA-103]